MSKESSMEPVEAVPASGDSEGGAGGEELKIPPVAQEPPRLRLERLELHGFKSFADPVDFEFREGITGIVGPNGCGKSNVVDALKWVLGEQRPTSVRGSAMLDTIFKGARGRAAADYAEVILHLETSALDGEGGDDRPSHRRTRQRTSIGRRLHSDGSSAYLFDNRTVRLKDVRSHLLDTGLGVCAYAVLEQGRIDAVLDANPIARRAVFEEAAGISRFRLQRREALAKLERTQINLEKVEERLDEMRRRINSLKRQAGRARRYKAVAERLRELRLLSGVLRLREVMRTIERGEQQLAQEEQRVNRLRAERRGREEEGHVLERRLQRLNDELEQVRRQLAGIEAEEGALDERRALMSGNLDLEQRRMRDFEQQARGLAEELLALESRREKLGGELEERRERERAAEEELERISANLRGERARLGAARQAKDALDEERFELTQQRTTASNQVHMLGGQIEVAEQRQRRLSERLESLEGEDAGLASEAAELAAGEKRAADALVEIRAEIEAIGDRRERADRERQELMATRLDLRTRSAALEARREALEDLDRELEGFDPGTRALLAGGRAGEAPEECPAGLFGGLLVDRIHAPSSIARAVETALGPALSALLASDLKAVRTAVDWLREGHLGRAVFVVPASCSDGRGPIEGPGGRTGVCGRLVAELKVDAGAEEVVEAVLGDVWLIDERADLEALMRTYPQCRFATRAGELFSGGMILQVVGGFLEEGAGIVPRKSALEELGREIEHLGEQLELTEGALARVSVELEAVAGLGADLARRERVIQGEVEELRSGRVRAEARLAHHREEIALVRRDLDDLLEQVGGLRTALAAAEAALEEGEAALGELGRRQAGIFTDLEQARAASEGRQQEEHRLRLRVKEMQGERHTVEESLGGVLRDLDSTRRRIAEVEEEKNLAEQRADQARRQIGELEVQRVNLGAQRESLGGEIERRRAEVEAHRREFEAHRLRSEHVQALLERTLESIQDVRLRVQDAGHRRADLCGRIREDYDLDLVEVLRERRASETIVELSEDELEEAESEIVTLRRDIDRIGGVNSDAVAELEEVQAQFQSIHGNCVDLRSAKGKLEETIAYLDRESRTRFLETFGAVRKHFQEIFRRLFNGGKADIELFGEGDDPLEKGIEIRARPAGKSLQTVGLLSGGERTLTAIAILFAMFMVKPSPFCLLDEVDAALDDANVLRFCALLDEFVKRTQFIVVTHNKHTMACCDVLYGVTMQDTGVSRRVAVRWEEIDEDGRFDADSKGEPEVILTPQPRRQALEPGA